MTAPSPRSTPNIATRGSFIRLRLNPKLRLGGRVVGSVLVPRQVRLRLKPKLRLRLDGVFIFKFCLNSGLGLGDC